MNNALNMNNTFLDTMEKTVATGFSLPLAHLPREIPYNYTSWTDQEIVNRLLGEEAWQILETLRAERVTGRSARMLFEVLGDIWAVRRNPYLEDDLIVSHKRRTMLLNALRQRINDIRKRHNSSGSQNNKVLTLINSGQKQVLAFANWLDETQTLRQKIIKRISTITHPDNIAFDPLSRVSHVTDATDWRVEYPFVVLLPDRIEEIAPMITMLKELALTIIARGGGTGYTGGVIPLDPHSAVINCEKLERIDSVSWIVMPCTNAKENNAKKVPTIRVEAGVVTRRVMEAAEAQDLVFAVDPTSADASCIGGNIAMNAGGKKAVIWGTTLDNLLSWKMVNPQSEIIEVVRMNHNLGKIHDTDEAIFEVRTLSAKGKILKTKTLTIAGKNFRKAGLGKDVTDKFLSGLPGIQKEGCDGFILEAHFILHQLPKYQRTFCVEFYGRVDKAIASIVAIKNFMDTKPQAVLLSGLEHLDARYIRAVGYTSKATRPSLPRMILIGDLAGDDETAVNSVVEEAIHLAKTCGIKGAVEGFIAKNAEQKALFWSDRSRTAAIAKHTNAFKINEDVVIPLPKLGEYSDGVELLNIQLSLENKLLLCKTLWHFFQEKKLPLHQDEEALPDDWLDNRVKLASTLIYKTQKRWQFILDNLDSPFAEVASTIRELGAEPKSHDEYNIEQGISEGDTLFRVIQYGGLRISWKSELLGKLLLLFQGQVFLPTVTKLRELHRTVLKSRLFIAIHMHAGDGNVHSNIPVNSDNADMLKRAHKVVGDIMSLARRLGGVISGEHGIGLTKIAYLLDEEIAPFRKYKQKIDPDGLFNRGKLMRSDGLSRAYTPSFSLIGHESLVLETTELGKIANDIKNCFRCGKCKPVCPTHVPRANILYSPRNKILGTSLLIEAILYSAQTRRGVSEYHVSAFNDLADHCTVCHKCESPCPVDIDFGDVTITIRQYLKNQHRVKTSIIPWFAMMFLSITDPRLIKFFRLFMVTIGYPAHRIASQLGHYLRLTQKSRKQPAKSTHINVKAQVREQVVQFINRPLPKKMPLKTARALLDIDYPNQIPIIRDPQKIAERSKAQEAIESIFYFPGCGSERLFSQVGIATQAMLYDIGVQCVLPPTYLCCGYPQLATGNSKQAETITTLNRVMFHRIANSLNYLDIKTVIVSCGTCIDQLEKYQFAQIFPGSRLMDIHEYLMEKGLQLDSNGQKYMYHSPCHSPMKLYKSSDVVNKLMGATVPTTDRCCGESGTLALSRPDVSNQIRFSKNESIKKTINIIQKDSKDKVKILTSCPSCVQGLARFENDAPITTDYIVVELARRRLGENWLPEFINRAKDVGVERVVF